MLKRKYFDSLNHKKSYLSKWDGLPEDKIIQLKREKITGIARKRPSKKEQLRILKKQQNKCGYCQIEIAITKLNLNIEKAVWDHFIPFSKCKSNNNSNFVAVCKRCNDIKSNKVFKTKKEVIMYILSRTTRFIQ